MKSYVSNIGKQLMIELRVLRDYHFEERCGTILRTVFPALTAVPARSNFDYAGIDHCMLADGEDDLLLTVQCKGFDTLDFGSSQLGQCLHSIETFANSSFKTKRHYLIVNRIVRDEAREKIDAALDELIRTGKADTAQLLDLQAFLELVFQEGQRQLITLLGNSVTKFQELHRSRMAEEIYVEKVPFRTADEERDNPLRFVKKRIMDLVSKQNNKRSWTFLSGEFGFGKTSLALHVAEALQNQGLICLYLPAAQFHRQAFEKEVPFLWEILQIVLQEEIDHANERQQILHAALKEILKREKRIVLIFDGIDEHPICWRENGLLSVFGIFKTFNTTCLFTVRDEFLAERTGHFQAAIKGSPGVFMLRLTEWPNDLILEYTRLFRKGVEISTDRERIGHFEEAVRTGQYVEYYGDIPKRPLFLKMLLDDVAKDDLRSRNLAQLYSIYITKKFEIDRQSSISNPIVLRPLNLNEDYAYVCARLFEVMTMAAGQMYTIENGEVRLQPRLSEIKLRECAKNVAGESLDLPSILLNSVLVPVGRRNKDYGGGHIEVAFAHTSFQEFFLAHYALTVLRGKNADVPILSATLPKPAARFLRGLISTLSPDEQTVIHSRYEEPNPTKPSFL